MGSRKRVVRPPADPETDPGAPPPGEEVPLIEAQDPALLDQQEGPVGAQVRAPGPRESRPSTTDPSPNP